MLTWEAPSYSILHYNLYRWLLDDGQLEIIGVDADSTSYFDEPDPGTYKYQLTAVYEDHESVFANTVNGNDYLIIEIPDYESVSEIEFDEIVEIMEIYNINGQILNTNNLDELNQGIYIIKGITESGKTTVKKIIKTN